MIEIIPGRELYYFLRNRYNMDRFSTERMN